MTLALEPVMDLCIQMKTGIIVNVVDRTRMVTPGHLVEKEQIGLGIEHRSEVVQNLPEYTSTQPNTFKLLRVPVAGTVGRWPRRAHVR